MTDTLLTAVRARLAPEGAWTQGREARDRRGSGTGAESLNAICWCIYGAAWRERLQETLGDGANRIFAEALGFKSFHEAVKWNDAPTTTHEMVLARIDLAIARARVGV